MATSMPPVCPQCMVSYYVWDSNQPYEVHTIQNAFVHHMFYKHGRIISIEGCDKPWEWEREAYHRELLMRIEN